MNLHPELEAYRDRLVERCAAWPDAAQDELWRDLEQCRDQTALLEKGIADLKRRLADASREESERLIHRISVQEQMRDLTAAYAEVLKRHLDKLAS